MTNVEQSAETLSSLIKPLLEEPGAFNLRVVDGAEGVAFKLSAGPRAARILSGKSGRHIRALQLFAHLIGQAQKETYWLHFNDDPHAEDHPIVPNPAGPDYEPSEEVALMQSLIDALGINAGVECVGAISGGFTFTIYPETQADEAALLDPHIAVFEHRQKERTPLNLISALRTWFNAIARSKGLSFTTQIE